MVTRLFQALLVAMALAAPATAFASTGDIADGCCPGCPCCPG